MCERKVERRGAGRKRKKERKNALEVGSESNGTVYGLGLFCTSKYTKKEGERQRERMREGKTAAGLFIVIVSPRSCGSAYILFLFFLFSLFFSSFFPSHIKQHC